MKNYRVFWEEFNPNSAHSWDECKSFPSTLEFAEELFKVLRGDPWVRDIRIETIP